MTYEEAKNNIEKNLDCGDVNNLDSEALCMAIEALEKQIPKKPKTTKDGYKCFSFDCPCCGFHIVSVIDGELCAGRKKEFCDHCGQAIDWSDEDEH